MEEYKNFDLYAFDYQEANGTRSFKVWVEDSPAGGQKLYEAVQVSLPEDLDNRLQSLQKRNLDLQEMIELGENLGTVLFPEGVHVFLTNSLANVRATEDRLRIRLKLDDIRLADIPWEYVYLSRPEMPEAQRGFLALNATFSLVRYETVSGSRVSLRPRGLSPLRIAVLLSDPNKPPDYPHLELDKEEARIRTALVKVRGRGVDHKFYRDATSDELLWACDSDILHFAGHGEFQTEQSPIVGMMEGKGALVLLDEDKGPDPYSVEKLQVILSGKPLRLAVLGACKSAKRDRFNRWSGIAPALARVGVPAVVGMQYGIQDKNAIHFSFHFYYALAKNLTIDEAVTSGRQAVFSKCQPDERAWRDWGVPVLYLRTEAAEDGMLFPVLSAATTGGSPITPTGEVTVRPTGMLAGTPAPGGSPAHLPAGQCLVCSAYVTGKFCTNCGTQLARCSECGTPLSANASFCGRCGQPVNG
jgi:hypothetical protein